MILGSLVAQLGTVDAQLGALWGVFVPPVPGPDTEVIVITVAGEDRMIIVSASPRVVTVASDDRVILVPDDRSPQ